MTKSVCPNPCAAPPPPPHLNTHTHAHTITEATSHKQSRLYLLQLEIQEIHFQNAIHFSILVSPRIEHGANYKTLLEIFLLQSLKYTYLNS